MFENRINNAFRFKGITTIFVNTLCRDVLDSQVVMSMVCRRENDEVASIELFVRKRNKARVLRAVVPTKTAHRLIESERDVQNALAFACGCRLVIVFLIIQSSLEERSWRKLLRIMVLAEGANVPPLYECAN